MFPRLPSEDDRRRCAGTISGLYNFIMTSFSSPLSTFTVLAPLSAVVSLTSPLSDGAAPTVFRASSTVFISACKSVSMGGILIGMFERLAVFTGLGNECRGGESHANSFTTISESLSDSFILEKRFLPSISVVQFKCIEKLTIRLGLCERV